MRTFLLSLVFLALATPAFASDGVLEINQTCATASLNTGCFSGDGPGFPVTISTAGSYRLTSNLIIPDANTDGIVVSTSDVGIDLNNFAIIRSGCEGATTSCRPVGGSGSGVRTPSLSNRGISVKNGSITGVGLSVRLGEQADVKNLRVRWCINGIWVDRDSIVSDNTTYENGFDGIRTAEGSIVSGNTSHDNSSFGIYAGPGSTISGNATYQNDVGIFADASSTVFDNTASNNQGNGIGVGAGSTVSGNTTSNNQGNGIVVEAGSTVSGNTANSNTLNGIVVSGGASSILDNTVRANSLDGIDGTDGGLSYVRGNSAIQNTGIGLSLIDLARGDAVYRDNQVSGNGGGTVSGGNERGGNSCRGLTGPITDCP